MIKYFVFNLLIITLISTYAKNILVIDSYHASYPWTMECRKGLDLHLDSIHTVTYMEMNTKCLHRDQHQKKADEVWEEVLLTRPDLVIIMDDNALKYLGQRVSDIEIPVVFMGINQNPRIYFKDSVIPRNVTGVLERPLLRRSLKFLSEINEMPNKRVLLMMDNGMTSDAIIKTSFNGEGRFKLFDIVMDTYLTGSYDDWKKKVKSLSADEIDFLIIANYATLKDSSGEHIPLDSTSHWTVENSSVPVFGFWKYSVGAGKAIGGLITSGYFQGKSAAQQANTILSTGQIPKVMIPKPGEHIYSRSELKRWGIELPKEIESETIFLE